MIKTLGDVYKITKSVEGLTAGTICVFVRPDSNPFLGVGKTLILVTESNSMEEVLSSDLTETNCELIGRCNSDLGEGLSDREINDAISNQVFIKLFSSLECSDEQK